MRARNGFRWRALAGGVIAFLVVVALVPALLWWALPEAQLEHWLEQRVSRRLGRPVDIGPLTKDLTPGLRAEFVTILEGDTPVTVAEPVRVRPRWRRAIGGELVVDVAGKSFGGDLSAEIRVVPQPLTASARVIGARLGEVLALLELDGAGIVDATVESMEDGAFDIRLGVYEVVPGPVLRSRVPLPITSVSAIEGQAEWIPGGVLTVTSASAESDEMYASLKGSVRKTALDLTLLLTPSARWLDEQPILAPMLERYRLGPGVFSIPVRGSIRNPRLG